VTCHSNTILVSNTNIKTRQTYASSVRSNSNYITKPSPFVYTVKRRPRVGEEVLMYSLFNFCGRSGWVVNASPHPLYSHKKELVSTVQEDGWAPRPVWTGAVSPQPGFDPRTLQSVARCSTDCAIPAHIHRVHVFLKIRKFFGLYYCTE